MMMCFPSMAPRQFGKFHLVLNSSATRFHSSGVVGVCRYIKRQRFQLLNFSDITKVLSTTTIIILV